MLKKFNVFALTLLILGQTILGPIGVASAESIVPASEPAEEQIGAEPTEPIVTEPKEPEIIEPEAPVDTPESDSDDQSGAADKGVELGQPANPVNLDGEDESEKEDSAELANKALQAATKAVEAAEAAGKNLTEEIYNKAVNLVLALDDIEKFNGSKEKKELQKRIAKLELPLEQVDEIGIPIPTTLTEFYMTINGDLVADAATRELEQDEKVEGFYTFKANLENGAHVKGSSFTFTLPNTILDFGDSFKGFKEATSTRPAFSYSTEGQVVTVKLDETIDPLSGLITDDMEFKLNFTAEFKFVDNDLEQELEIPKADGSPGTDEFTLTFLPSTSDKTMEKNQFGDVETQPNGERHITWVVWVNEAGKELVNATLEDSPSQIPNRHTVIPNTVKVERYAVGLKGIPDKNQPDELIQEGGNFNFTMSGKNAYKITYKTLVDIKDADGKYLSGSKTFTNTATLKDKEGEKLDSDNSNASVTFGLALDKELDKSEKNTNYKSHWAITYNYNLAPIPKAQAIITDSLPGSHDIDISSIKVYKMNVGNTGNASGPGTEVDLNTNYTISNDSDGNGFKLTILPEDGGDNVTGAYRITYEANYTDVAHPKFKLEDEEITNSVWSGTYPDPITPKHDVVENILTKTNSYNTTTKEITWTITVNNKGNDEAISNLLITDTFDSKGKHKLSGEIKVTNMTGQTIIPDSDPYKGFTITGGSVAADQIATITYVTIFDIEADGSVNSDGYENIVRADWKDSQGNDYDLTKESLYKPDSATTSNGFKTGTFNYDKQEFEWQIRVNVNKQNINDAKLVDQLGPGHKIKPGSFKVNEYIFDNADDDRTGHAGAALKNTLYELVPAEDGKSFTLTFGNNLDTENANNKVYLITYNTVDSDKILGISKEELTEASTGGASYTDGALYQNSATFITKVNGNEKSYTLPKEDVTVAHANKLVKKPEPDSNSTNKTYTWTVKVNESHSELGEVVLKDTPSDNLMLLPGSIEYQEVTQNANGSLTPGSWKTIDGVFEHDYTTEGGFKIKLGDLTKKSINIRYTTLVLGQEGEPFRNDAKITFGFSDETSENQETKDKYEERLAFSASAADASAGKGNLSFKKVSYNPATGVKSPLENVKFELVKTVSGTDYVLHTATSNDQGEFSFKGVSYGTFKLVEYNPHSGYESLPASYDSFVVSADNDTLKPGNEDKVEEVVNEVTVDPDNMCRDFTLTVKDEDGKKRTDDVKLKLTKDGVDKEFTAINGEVQIPRGNLDPGTYQVVEIDANGNKVRDLNTVDVKYLSPDCKGEVQPSPACEDFTVIVIDKNENGEAVPRPGVTVTVRDKTTGKPVDEASTTDKDGKITVPSGKLPAGTYDVFEGGIFLGEIEVSYTGPEGCKATVNVGVPNAGTCPDFTLIVLDRSGKPQTNTKVTVKDGDIVVATDTTSSSEGSEGKITFQNTIKPGTYKVYDENDKLIGSFTVKDTCEATVKPSSGGGGGGIPPAPACDMFTVTVKQQGATVGANVELTLKSGTTEVKGTTDANGKIVFAKDHLPKGSYTAYDKDGNNVGTVTVSYDEDKCQDEIDLPVKSCEAFTIIVKESGKVVEAGTSITLKGASGKTITGTTDATGKMSFDKADLPEGSYTAYDADGDEVGTVIVTYDEGNCQAIIDLVVKACEQFTLTIVNTPNKVVEIKDKDGNVVVTGTTDATGKVIFTQPIPKGNYDIFIDGKKVADLPVTDSCEATVTPKGDSGTNPPTPPDGGNGEEVIPPNPNPETPGGGDGVSPPGSGGDDNGNVDPPGAGNGGTGVKPPGSGNNGDKPGSGNTNNGAKLPQTGEEQFMYMIALGILFLAAGSVVLFRQRRKA